MLGSRSEANLLSFKMCQKILTEFLRAKLKSDSGVRLRGFLGPKGNRVKGSQTIYLDRRGLLVFELRILVVDWLRVSPLMGMSFIRDYVSYMRVQVPFV